MRATFVFTPVSSPTYLPLGLASITGYVRSRVPSVDLAALDLNLRAWRGMIAGDTELETLDDFLRHDPERFYDPAQYRVQQRPWGRLRQRMATLALEMQTYAEGGEAESAPIALLDSQVAAVMRSDPELVGFSLTYLEQLPFALALARRLNEVCTSKSARVAPRVIFGGAAMSALNATDLLLACPFVDGVVVGEGEAAAAALCGSRHLSRNSHNLSGASHDLSRIPGLVYRDIDGIRRNASSPPLSLDGLPAPDFGDLALREYFNPVPVLPVLFSRGCAWRRCRFCAHNFSFADHRRKRVASFVAELASLGERWGTRHFYLADQQVAPEDLAAIGDAIVAQGIGVSLHAMARPVEDFTPTLLSRIAKAGCRWLSWGVESGSQRLLDLCNKGTRVATIERALTAAHDTGIANLAMMIFGLPTSTDADLEETLAFLERAYGAIDEVTESSFVLFSGTPFARDAERYRLAISGPEILAQIAGQDIRARRLRYQEIASDGSLRPPRGPLEIARWTERRRWLGDPPLSLSLPSEHLLLYADKRYGEFGPRS